ncbi:ATM interactor-like isoform X2 [Pecten maximus]|uniref:ATM interactor-like isoform X1 n=1 Tax=Pecten maximus TaxID=6579 RepID=UPI0014586E56|nr:ATM interactor-like isoform X1 [Pecten maximus]XP_033755040.1 ATM interactor-like isoform X2 [Pecten maximus]
MAAETVHDTNQDLSEPTKLAMTLDESRGVWIVCPPEGAFGDVQCNVPCPIENCGQILPTTSCLRMHIRKTHGIEQKSSSTKNGGKNADFPTEYHCPMTSCPYNISSPRHFSSMKLLRQHFNKVHAEKKYKCGKCDAAFGLNRDKERHEVRCGIVYKCGTCQCPYTTREAMLTHCQRKSHDIPAEIIKAREDHLAAQKAKKLKKRQLENQLPNMNPFGGQPPPKVILVNIQPAPGLPTKPSALGKVTHHKPILCKPTPNINLIPLTTVTVTLDNVKVNQEKVKEKHNVDIQNISQGSIDNSGDGQSNENSDANSSQTQIANTQTQALVMETGMQTNVTIPHRKTMDNQRNAAQTQTTGDLILQAAMATANIPIHKLSVGTQMTPRSKVRALQKGSVCSIETQTVNDQATARKRRRRKGPILGAPLRIDSTSQTSAGRPFTFVTMTNDSTCQVESVGMMSTCVQTNRMVDNICQTLATPLQDVCHEDLLQYSSAAQQIKMGKNKNASKNRNQFISSKSVASMITDVGTSDSSRHHANQAYSKRPRATGNQQRKTASTGTNCLAMTVPHQHCSDMTATSEVSPRIPLNTGSIMSQGTSTDLDLGDEFQNFLISTCRDISVGTDVDEMQSSTDSDLVYTKRLPSSTFSDFVEASTQVMDTINKTSVSTEFNITSTNVFCGQSEKGQDVGSMTSDLQQNISDFVSLTDSQVQTLTSASDLDSLLRSTQTNTEAPETLMDMHTQTINDFDVFDLLMNNMETQTTDDLDLDNFSFTDIQTQTMFDLQPVEDPLLIVGEDTQSSATQTTTGTPNQSEATQTPQLGSACLTDTQTQTPLPGLFSLTNTHTQTTLDDLANIFAQFD